MVTLLLPDNEPEDPALLGAFRRATMLAHLYADNARRLSEEGSPEVRAEVRDGVNEDWRRLDGGKSLKTLCEWALFDALDFAARAHPDTAAADHRLAVFENWWPEAAGRISQAAFREVVAAWANRSKPGSKAVAHVLYLLRVVGLRSGAEVAAVEVEMRRWAKAASSTR